LFFFFICLIVLLDVYKTCTFILSQYL